MLCLNIEKQETKHCLKINQLDSLIFHSFFVQIIVMITFFWPKKWVSGEFKLFVDKQLCFMKEDIALSQDFLLVC
jgi:hypothetical protein